VFGLTLNRMSSIRTVGNHLRQTLKLTASDDQLTDAFESKRSDEHECTLNSDAGERRIIFALYEVVGAATSLTLRCPFPYRQLQDFRAPLVHSWIASL
jgi:hypothetical protein